MFSKCFLNLLKNWRKRTMSEERKRVDFDYNCEYYKFFKILSVYYIYIKGIINIFEFLLYIYQGYY